MIECGRNVPGHDCCTRRELDDLFFDLLVIVEADQIGLVVMKNACAIGYLIKYTYKSINNWKLDHSHLQLTANLRPSHPGAILAYDLPCRPFASHARDTIERDLCARFEAGLILCQLVGTIAIITKNTQSYFPHYNASVVHVPIDKSIVHARR